MAKKSEIPLPKFDQEIPKPILVTEAEKAGLVPKEVFGLSLSQILTDLKSSNRYVKCKALELLAIYLSHLIDLDFRSWLLRSADSDGTEVGFVANDRQVPFNRWQIQCRNARQVDMEEIATGVGRSVSFKPNILLSVTTGRFTQQARHYVTRAMQLTNLQILLIDAHDLRAIAKDEMAVKSILSRETGQAKSAKELQVAPLCA